MRHDPASIGMAKIKDGSCPRRGGGETGGLMHYRWGHNHLENWPFLKIDERNL